ATATTIAAIAATRSRRRTGDAGSGEGIGLAHTVPFGSGLWRAPTILAERRRSEWNAFEDTDRWLAGADRTGKQTGVNADLLGNHRRGLDKHRGEYCQCDEACNS